MQPEIPEGALSDGFLIQPISAHTSRTMMFRELSWLLDASPPCAGYDELARLVLEENVCLKDTSATRRETLRRLRELYGLRSDLAVFTALRDLWDGAISIGINERPLLALLCASARDALLRASAPAVLNAAAGSVVTPSMLESAVQSAYPDRYSPGTRASLGRHLLSSWTQSRHLEGRVQRVRRHACSGPASATYAMLLGHLCGARGLFLYNSFWTRLLDTAPSSLDSLAFMASQRGWLDYRRIGDVVEIGFSHLLRSRERQ